MNGKAKEQEAVVPSAAYHRWLTTLSGALLHRESGPILQSCGTKILQILAVRKDIASVLKTSGILDAVVVAMNSYLTADSPLLSTDHDRLRRAERQIEKITLQEARRYGMAEKQSKGRIKYTYAGHVFIYDPRSNRAISSWKKRLTIVRKPWNLRKNRRLTWTAVR